MAACSRFIGKPLGRTFQNAVLAAEARAEGQVGGPEFMFALQVTLSSVSDPDIRRLIECLLATSPGDWAGSFVDAYLACASSLRKDLETERYALAETLREVVGNPFRPTQLPGWAVQGEPLRLAGGFYRRRQFSYLPVLADALEDRGLAEPRYAHVLEHLRERRQHTRGCWALDLILEKPCRETAPRGQRLAT